MRSSRVCCLLSALIFGACSDGIVAPSDSPDVSETAASIPLSVGSVNSVNCILEIRRRDGSGRYKAIRLMLPRNAVGNGVASRLFIYRSDADPDAAQQHAACMIPNTPEAADWLTRIFLHRPLYPPADQLGGSSLSAISNSEGECSPETNCYPLDPIIVAGEPECDPYYELDWECECDGPGVENDVVAAGASVVIDDPCDNWDDTGDEDEDPVGGGGGTADQQDPPSYPPDGVSQSEYNQLNTEEKRLCWASPTQCISVWSARNHALDYVIEEALVRGYTGTMEDDEYDAMRHAFWNAAMARTIGVTRAEIWATAHESDNAADDPAVCMDLANNASGRDVGAMSAGKTYQEMEQTITTMAFSQPPQLQISPGC